MRTRFFAVVVASPVLSLAVVETASAVVIRTYLKIA
jgi:hypothetical protein